MKVKPEQDFKGLARIYFFCTISLAASTRSSGMRPKYFSSSSALPEDRNGRDPDPLKRHGVTLPKQFGNCTAKPTDNRVFLCGHNSAGLTCRGNDQFFISGLMVAICTTRAEIPCSCSSSAAASAWAVIRPVPMKVRSLPSRSQTALADRKAVVVGKDRRHLVSAEPHVDRPLVGGSSPDGQLCLNTVSRHDNGHVRHSPHDGDIFDRLVRTAVFADGYTAVRGNILTLALG